MWLGLRNPEVRRWPDMWPRPDLGRRRCHGVIDTRAMCLEVRSAAPLPLYGQPAARVSDRWCGGLGLWRKAACTRGIRMHTADQSAAPDERVGLCTCPEHAAYTWTGHVYVRLCRMCVLSEACSMHMAYVHARSHARLRASRDRRCPLRGRLPPSVPDTGVTG